MKAAAKMLYLVGLTLGGHMAGNVSQVCLSFIDQLLDISLELFAGDKMAVMRFTWSVFGSLSGRCPYIK